MNRKILWKVTLRFKYLLLGNGIWFRNSIKINLPLIARLKMFNRSSYLIWEQINGCQSNSEGWHEARGFTSVCPASSGLTVPFSTTDSGSAPKENSSFLHFFWLVLMHKSGSTFTWITHKWAYSGINKVIYPWPIFVKTHCDPGGANATCLTVFQQCARRGMVCWMSCINT